MKTTVTIADHPIGADHPPYVICELSANHNGSLEKMLELVDAAANTGCDAIKIQSYTPDTMTLKSDREEFRISGGLWDGRTLYDLYEEAYTPFEWHEAIFERAASHNVPLFSSPFDRTSVDLLVDLGAPAFKIASFELTDLDLIAYVARQGKPMIVSTGLASLAEIDEAVRTAREAGCQDLILLHCVSSYPAPNELSNLRTIPNLEAAFGCPVGLSDHTHGTATSVAAVALGARVIEKHFTIRRADGGPDSAFSLEPEEFSRLCSDCRHAFDALGEVSYELKGQENANIMFRRSIFASKDIAAGEPLSADNIRVVRPGHGLAPKELGRVLGRVAKKDIKMGEPLNWEKI